MSPPRLYTEQPLSAPALLELDAAAAHHAVAVLRMQVGAELTLCNGDGCEYPAVIRHIEKRRVTVETSECHAIDRESPLAVVLGLGVSRGDRMDFAVQKATELGVATIVPLLTDRAGVSLRGERARKKTAHWRHVAVSACEQSGRNRVPDIQSPMELTRWLATVNGERRLVLDPTEKQTLEVSPAPRSVTLLIGPEGGLSAAEIARARDAGFDPVALGPRTLRTETAPVAAIAVCQFLWGDLS